MTFSSVEFEPAIATEVQSARKIQIEAEDASQNKIGLRDSLQMLKL